MKGAAVFAAWLCVLLVFAAGAEDMPQQVRTDYFQYGWEESEVADTLALQDEDGNDWYLIASKSGGLEGYICKDGVWQCWLAGSCLFRAEDTRFVRHEEGAAFDAVSADLDARMSYRVSEEDVFLTGWRDGNAWPGSAEIKDGAVVFYPDGQGAPIEIPMEEGLKSWVERGDFEYMAKTPEEMRARAAIGPSGVKALMPGWTLGFYDVYNDGTMAEAGFYRIENGSLTLCWLVVSSDAGVESKTESLTVPLSASLLARLQTEDMSALLDCSGYGSVFLTDDAWDSTAIPIRGKIIENDLQQHSLVALTERDGVRRISVAEPDADGRWQVRETPPLPENTTLDLFHTCSGEISPEWEKDDDYFQCGYCRTLDGSWHLRWVMSSEAVYAVKWYGVQIEDQETWDSLYVYGTPLFQDLFSADMTRFPSVGKTGELTDPTNWASVKNPDPKERLHLRTKPQKSADSLGKFYNGTPLQVLETRGDWCRVRVGRGQALEGWMMKKYLAFGKALQRVSQAFPDLFLREEYEGASPRGIDGKQDPRILLDGTESIIGVREAEKQWILMTQDGNICFVSQAWFWEGNG